jgi:hypothetical protein
LSGLRAPDISLTRLFADYLTSTRLTPYYSESTIFNFLLIPILPTETDPGELAKFIIFDNGCKDTGSEIHANSTSGLTTITPDLTSRTGIFRKSVWVLFNFQLQSFLKIPN